MTEEKLTYASVSLSILRDMLSQYTEEIITKSVMKEKLLEEKYGTVTAPKFIDSRNEERFPRAPSEEATHGSQRRKHHNSHNNGNSSRSTTPQPVNLQKEPDIGRFQFNLNGNDIYKNAFDHNGPLMGEKAAQLESMNGNDIYFRCSNCQREIAGVRFAAHIDKCLGGRFRKIKD